ncbi:DpnI domain-containing protein [Arcanobacterium phocae]|uniref:DpnI domain-containing protein n=1 Tax=Arcanobacterium phocae TaxID=131112 RepID=UPI001C0EAC6C|nr:DpnI domain-containing protein [Arcanobacterium phocae]
MNLKLDMSLVQGYRSSSQQIRVASEAWVAQHVYCPYCGNPKLDHFENNRPVADLFCGQCAAQYELKSKSGKIGSKITDGAYATMIERITSNQNPDLFVMSYDKDSYVINSLLMVPKYFFAPKVIEKRKPLADTARRAGWVGCNILFSEIPQQALAYLIKDGQFTDFEKVRNQVSANSSLHLENPNLRGWLLDVLICIEQLGSAEFSLRELYNFEHILGQKHPQNKNVKAKIRQQLQLLRDRGFIEFLGNGYYRRAI